MQPQPYPMHRPQSFPRRCLHTKFLKFGRRVFCISCRHQWEVE